MIDCKCEICGNPFKVYPADIRKGGGRCCGVICRNRRLAKLNERDFKERFWEKVNKTATCWLWTGGKNWDGYGQMTIDGRNARANRVSWEIHNGPVPSGMHVLHNCPGGDNPSCVNPEHLWLGTDADNSNDCKKKGRKAHGERHWSAKLTDSIVLDIRREYANGGISHGQLAVKHNISRSAMQQIIERTTWTHLPC